MDYVIYSGIALLVGVLIGALTHSYFVKVETAVETDLTDIQTHVAAAQKAVNDSVTEVLHSKIAEAQAVLTAVVTSTKSAPIVSEPAPVVAPITVAPVTL